MRNFRMLVVRARHDPTVPSIPDSACLDAVMTGSQSLFRYWQDTSQGYFDFNGSNLLPWVDIVVGADTGRAAVGKLAIDAARRLPGPDPLSACDGVLVLVHPGQRQIPNPTPGPGQPATITQAFDGGTTGLYGKSVAVVPLSTSDFTFMSHECGHVLGFEHTFGLINNGTDWNGAAPPIIESHEYGSPYDLMSSASFGTRWQGTVTWFASPVFPLPPIVGWTQSRNAGPHMSRANLHLWASDAMAGSVDDRPYPPLDGQVSARVWAPDRAGGPRLLALHPPGEPASGVGRLYVEFRPQRGWDAGLDPLGPDLARAGVVVHEVVDVPGVGPRAWYRCTVPNVSIDRDAMISNHPLAVEVTAVDPELSFATVVVKPRRLPRVQVDVLEVSLQDAAWPGPTISRRTPCGDEIQIHQIDTRTTFRYRTRATGLGAAGQPFADPVRLAWSIAGIPLASTAGTVNVSIGGINHLLTYSIGGDLQDLSVTSASGEVVEVEVTARVSDQMQFAVGSADFRAEGSRSWMRDDDREKLASCLKRFQRWVIVQPPPFRIPIPDPPNWDQLRNPRVTAERWARAVQAQISKCSRIDAEMVEGIRQLVAIEALSAGAKLFNLDGDKAPTSESR